MSDTKNSIRFTFPTSLEIERKSRHVTRLKVADFFAYLHVERYADIWQANESKIGIVTVCKTRNILQIDRSNKQVLEILETIDLFLRNILDIKDKVRLIQISKAYREHKYVIEMVGYDHKILGDEIYMQFKEHP